MTETAKTVTFVGIGIAAVAIALVTRPKSAELDFTSLVGEAIVKDFTKPSEIKRIQIVRFDSASDRMHSFEVAEKGGLWTLPSKDGYPADASEQMAKAATMLVGRKILDVKPVTAAEHETFGVVEPSQSVKVGQQGVGMKIAVWGNGNEPLANLIVGKEVAGAAKQRYVRISGQDTVYVIELDPKYLSTKFEDWIEKDLLKLSPLDLQAVDIKDYSAKLVLTQDGRPGIAWAQRSEMSFGYNDKDQKWIAQKLRKYDQEKNDFADVTLTEDEELNKTALDVLKTALDDLSIVDVERKPQGLSNDLKAGGDFLNDREAIQNLMTRGFAPASRQEGGEQEIISSEGEVVVTMKNGAEYVLRFGDPVRVTEDFPDEGKDVAKNEAAKQAGLHRYLFVMARMNEGAVPKPELQDLPTLPAGAGGDQPASGTPASGGENAIKKDADGEPASADESVSSDSPQLAGDSAVEPATTASNQDAKQDEAKQGEAKQGETTGAAAQPAADEKDKELEKMIADRTRLEAENKRKLEDYQATLTKGREKVKELNLSFGDWYFVIDNDVFGKIRLNLDTVVKKKEAKDAKGDAEGDNAAMPAASNFGRPGTAIPGVPVIPNADK